MPAHTSRVFFWRDSELRRLCGISAHAAWPDSSSLTGDWKNVGAVSSRRSDYTAQDTFERGKVCAERERRVSLHC